MYCGPQSVASNSIRNNRKIIVPRRKLQCLGGRRRNGRTKRGCYGKTMLWKTELQNTETFINLTAFPWMMAGELPSFYTLCRWNIVVSSKQARSRRRRESVQEQPHSKVKARRGRISILKWCVMITNFIIIICWSRRRQDIVSTWEAYDYSIPGGGFWAEKLLPSIYIILLPFPFI